MFEIPAALDPTRPPLLLATLHSPRPTFGFANAHRKIPHYNSYLRVSNSPYRVAMSEEKLCAPCEMLLSRGRKDSPSSGLPADWIPFIEHHHDSASFERALQLPCSLCTLAWTSLKTTLPLLSGGTEYQIIPVHRAGGVTIAPDVRFISFRHSSGMKYGTVAFVPWQGLFNRFLEYKANDGKIW